MKFAKPLFFALTFAFMGIGTAQADYRWPTEKLNFAKLRPASSLEVVDHSGKVLGYWPRGKHMIYRPLTEISPRLAEYVVLSEDAKFWFHEGFDVEEIKKSVSQNIEAGKLKRGGSTISQQLVKNLFLDKKKTFSRKLFEIPWTLRLEKDLSKKQILELYLNVIEWGPGIYGAEAASRYFFDKSAADISDSQALYLAMIVPNPNRFNALAHPKILDFLEKKKTAFLNRLVDEKKMDKSTRDRLASEGFGLRDLTKSDVHWPLQSFPDSSSDWLAAVKKSTGDKMPSGSLLKLKIDSDTQSELQKLPLAKLPGTKGRWAVMNDDNAIRALRWVNAGSTLVPPEGEEIRYVDRISKEDLIESSP